MIIISPLLRMIFFELNYKIKLKLNFFYKIHQKNIYKKLEIVSFNG